MKNLLTAVTFMALITTASAFADEAKQPMGQKIEKRVEHQNARIDRKLKNKKITEEKAAELKKDVQAIEVKKDSMVKEGNGKLTKEQRKELHGELKKTSEEIKASGSPAAAH